MPRILLLCGRGFAAGLLAGALGDVLPFAGVVVGLRQGRASMLGGAAVVLAGFRDAITLLGAGGLLHGFSAGEGGAQNEKGGNGGGQGGLVLHVMLLSGVGDVAGRPC